MTPCLVAEGASKLIEFLKQAFGAEERFKMARPDGGIMHAEIKIGDSILMLGEATDQWKPITGAIYLYVNNADAVYKRALQAGATSIMEPMDQFYGDRHGGVKDPAGNIWWIATHKEDVPPEELKKRAEAFMKQQEQRR
jgi:PhnB protein